MRPERAKHRVNGKAIYKRLLLSCSYLKFAACCCIDLPHPQLLPGTLHTRFSHHLPHVTPVGQRPTSLESLAASEPKLCF